MIDKEDYEEPQTTLVLNLEGYTHFDLSNCGECDNPIILARGYGRLVKVIDNIRIAGGIPEGDHHPCKDSYDTRITAS